jgi:hypothetical protein
MEDFSKTPIARLEANSLSLKRAPRIVENIPWDFPAGLVLRA